MKLEKTSRFYLINFPKTNNNKTSHIATKIITLINFYLEKLCTFNLLWKFIFFILFSTSLRAQTFFIDNNTLKPIMGVRISCEEIHFYTNKNGEVNLDSFPEKKEILCYHIGYKLLTTDKETLLKLKNVLLYEQINILPTVEIGEPLRQEVVIKEAPLENYIISADAIKNEKPQNTADILQHTGSVFVQKTQAGGGSPNIRGFEANKVLLVLDGIRMNNAIYRSGHLQNSLSIDNSTISQIDIFMGSNSVLYGSDALGGTIHFHTKLPELASKSKWNNKINFSTFFNTVDRSMQNNINFNIAKKKWGLWASYSNSNYSDFEMGKNRLHEYEDWGLQHYTYKNINGTDSSAINKNQHLQTNTGYTQHDLLSKLFFKPSESINYIINLQYSTTSNIGRYDMQNQWKNDNLRYAEWYYGPQQRILSSFQINFLPKHTLISSGSLILAYQRIDEDRISRLFNHDEKLHQLEDIQVLSVNLDLNKLIDSSKVIYYGCEIQSNFAKSTAYYQNIFNEKINNNATTRYPDLGSFYMSSGLYIQYKQQINPKLLFTSGLRFSIINASSSFGNQTEIPLTYQKFQLLNTAPSASLNLSFHPDNSSKLNFRISTGFRAPNIDDYGKVFEKDGNTIIPNLNLKPEHAINSEVSINKSFFNKNIILGTNFYSIYLINTIIQSDFSLNGSDSLFFNGEMTKLKANQNANQAIIYGISSFIKFNIFKTLSLNATYNYTNGINLENENSLDHITPEFGKMELLFMKNQWNSSVYSYYNLRKSITKFGNGTSENIEEATDMGIPAWWTLNYKLLYQVKKNMQFQFYLTNVLDIHYRQFSSSISSPGRSFKIGLNVNI